MAKYERPEYTVLLSEEPFELREYRDFYIVEYDNAADPDVDSGFGTLFRYISKDNQANRKISMTVPVIQELSDNRTKMAFVVPKAEWEDIPQPNSPALTVKKFENGLFAVIQYGGIFERSERARHAGEVNSVASGEKIPAQFKLYVGVFQRPLRAADVPA